jgi:hypothetical protein
MLPWYRAEVQNRKCRSLSLSLPFTELTSSFGTLVLIVAREVRKGERVGHMKGAVEIET